MIRPVLLAFALMLCGCASSSAQSGAALRNALPSFAPLVRRVVPSVVNIAVTENVSGGDVPVPAELRGTPFEKKFRDRLRSRREQVMGAGSGFIIDSSGIIVTNNHVVGHADKIVVSLTDGTELTARVIGTDELTDIAVIKVDSAAASLPAVTWGDSRAVEVGDWILAAGNPFGLGSSVSAGIVSARGRDIGAGPFDDFLQIDAPINPGNSGGPTFNLDGQVVAVNTAIVSPTGGSVGIGFAIPSEIAQKIVAELREKGHIERGWLGVAVQDQPNVGGGKARNTGVLISAVERAGPAAKAGLLAGDLVVSINGTPVDSAHELIKAVSATPPGNSVRLSVRRRGQTVEVPVTVGRRPNESAG